MSVQTELARFLTFDDKTIDTASIAELVNLMEVLEGGVTEFLCQHEQLVKIMLKWISEQDNPEWERELKEINDDPRNQ